MEDVLTAHAERVAAANCELARRLAADRDEADARMREKVSAFGARLVDIAKEIEATRIGIVADLEAIIAQMLQSSDSALEANVAVVALSAAAMQGQIADRTIFMTTGKLPAQAAQLPGGTQLVFRDDDPAPDPMPAAQDEAATDDEAAGLAAQ